MSYSVDTLESPYRRMMETRQSYSRSSSGPGSSGYRTQTWSRASPVNYKRPMNVMSVPVARTYSGAVMSTADVGELNSDYGNRANEKEQLQGLNDRFAVYIDKVHYLEEQNRRLEEEIRALRQKQATRAQPEAQHERELQELRGALEQLHGEKARAQLDAARLEDDIHRLRARFDDEARSRSDIEAVTRAVQKDAGDAGLSAAELEKKIRCLQDEVAFIRADHEHEVNDLLAQLQAAATVHAVGPEKREWQKAELTEALREIRTQLEGHSSRNLQQVEDWFMCRYVKLSEAAEQNKDAIKSARDEISDYRRQLQAKTVELESARGTKDSLERQLTDIEDRHNTDLSSLQETIHQLDNELKSTKWEMTRHLREYQDLLNVKMALDIEIAAYRKLLEGEETHFSTYPYRQTVSKGTKVKAEPPKLRVQHKFVEEIIEETRVENEKSEMDEALAEMAAELSAQKEDEAEEEEEEGKEEAEEGEEEEVEEEEEVLAASQAKVSAAAPGEEGEEEEEEAKQEEEEGEEQEEEEGKGDEKGEENEGEEEEKGEDAEEEEEGEEEEEEVEETVLSSKAPESKAQPEKKAEEEEGAGEEEEGEDVGDKKEEEEGDEKESEKKEEEEEKEDQKVKDDKEDAASAKESTKEKASSPKSESPKASSPKSESPKASSPKSESPKPESPKSESPKASSPKSESPKASSPKPESPKEDSKVEETKKDAPKPEPTKTENAKKDTPTEKPQKADAPKTEPPKADSTEKPSKEEKSEETKPEKKDAAASDDAGKASKDKKEPEKRDVISNGVDESPTKDEPSQKVVITKTVETITTDEGGAKHVTKSITVTESVKAVDEVVEEQLVSTKKLEKVSTQVVKQTTETE